MNFDPLVAGWFASCFPGGATEVQRRAWAEIARGVDTLMAAPTGSGKTLAAFLWAIDGLAARARRGPLDNGIDVVYVSPLKALGNDIEKNLREPLAGIGGLDEIRVAVRSGDTPSYQRELQARRPPHILITTPESLYILLTSKRAREALARARTVIVDEIHAVAADKRGAHLALSLERLDRLAGRRLQRIGLSATQRPIREIAGLLTGANRTCSIVDLGHRRELELAVELPHDLELSSIVSAEMRETVYRRIAALAEEHRSTIVFVDTRRMVERTAHALGELMGKERVAAHHGSLSRHTRLAAEEGLKSGSLPVVVASASLELGIDVGHVDLVCQIGAPRSLATLLQRVGRSGHFLGAKPKGIVFPLTRDQLVQSAAAVSAVGRGELDSTEIVDAPRDILAQQLVAETAAAEAGVEDLWAMVRRAWPYRDLARGDFDAVVEMLAEGVATRHGRRSAHLHYDRAGGRVRGRRGARLAAITSGGAIPDTADYDVIEDPAGAFVGTVNEDFAVESLAGDIFLLGNRSWRILRVEAGRVRVADAGGAPPNVPFWMGEAPARSFELSQAVSRLRRRVADDTERAAVWLVEECALDDAGARQLTGYIAETVAALGDVPTLDKIIAERFFDESGGMQLVIHSPWGGRVNRAFGLALRKKFCVRFDFELQAAATDDGIVLSLGEQHSFPLEAIFGFLTAANFKPALVQSALQSPMFTNRWRWNASRALALLRFQGGKRVPMPIQRMRAEDLLAAVFPAQLGCQDNRVGDIEPPDHPLVDETLKDCLQEAMDAGSLGRLLEDIESGRLATAAIDTAAPSPMSHEILGANPYAFLDDAPLEERRARAVALRRSEPDLARGIGRLDGGAIDTVMQQAWPFPDPGGEAGGRQLFDDEVHDALITLVVIDEPDRRPWRASFERLRKAGRVVELGQGLMATAERASLARMRNERGTATVETLRGWLQSLGPVTAPELSQRTRIGAAGIEGALAALESEGTVIRGSFRPAAGPEQEWCERALLARIHRMTLGRLRREIEPVSQATFMRFLARWQHATAGTRLHGRDGLRAIVDQLGGLELPAPAWERDILPLRLAQYRPEDLESLCLAGEVAWARLVPKLPEPGAAGRKNTPSRSAPLAFFLREDMDELLVPIEEGDEPRRRLSDLAREVFEELESRGASFLTDIARASGRLPSEVEEGLWELVSAGLVSGDGIAGLRTLLPRRRRRGHLRSVKGRASQRLMPVGRWSLLREAGGGTAAPEARVEAVARRLLARNGILFRALLAREPAAPPWRELLRCLRTMEARGEVRGGRFVEGVYGEHFALAEAVDLLRSLRRSGNKDTELLVVAAADPLNLLGIVGPGGRLSPYSGKYIAYRDGVAVETGELGEIRSRLAAGSL